MKGEGGEEGGDILSAELGTCLSMVLCKFLNSSVVQ